MKNKVLHLFALAALACCFLLAGVLVACDTGKNGAHIDVPSEAIEVQIGEYEVPIPDVVDADGVVLSGYEVGIQSIKDKDGNNIAYQNGTIVVSEPNTVYIVYVAEGVENATLTVNFVKTEPPALVFEGDGFPNYFFSGLWYNIPAYKTDGLDLGKTVISVYWLETENDADPELVKEDVTMDGGFEIEHNSGYYKVVFHLEDNYGNAKDYPFTVPLGGPESVVEDAFVYFEDAFGVEQVSGKYGWLDFEYVAAADLPDGVAKGNAAGFTHVTVDEALETTTGEFDISVDLPYIQSIDVDGENYRYLYFDVYNASDAVIPLQLAWTETRPLAPHAWTHVAYPLDLIRGGVVSDHVTPADITGLQIFLGNDVSSGKNNAIIAREDIDLYFGNMYLGEQGTNYVVPENNRNNDQIFYFNTAAGVDHISYRSGNAGGYKFTFKDGFKDNDTGLTGVTVITNNDPAKKGGGASGDFILNAAYITDVSDYGLVAFRVYNPNETTTAYIGILTSDSPNGTYMQYDIAPLSWATVYMNVDQMTATSVVNGVSLGINSVKFVIGGIKENEQLYLGAAYGIKTEDVVMSSVPELGEVTLLLNEKYHPDAQEVSISQDCSLTWARGDVVPNFSFKVTGALLNGEKIDVSADGSFAPPESGTYTLVYSLVFTGKGETVCDWAEPIEATVKITVEESAPPVTLEEHYELSKTDGDKKLTITPEEGKIQGEFVSLEDTNGNKIECSYKDGVFTFTAEALEAAADGETVFTVFTKDGGVNRVYKISVTVWKNIISDPTELQAFAADLNQATTEASALKGWYKLDADIDMTEIDFVFGDLYGNPEKPEEGGNRFFAGLFDGEGHSIKGMKTGNRGLFNMVQHGAVVKNVAIVDAYAYGYKADGIQTEKNVSHGSNILAEWFCGALENVYVSGSVGSTRWAYSGVVDQMRADSIKDCIFNVTIRPEATGSTDFAFGMWVTNPDLAVMETEDIVFIYTGAENKKMGWLGDPVTISTYANDAECYAEIDISKFDSAYWSKEADGIYFGDEKVVSADALPVDLDGSYELSKTEKDAMLSFTLTDTTAIQGEIVSVKDAYGTNIAFSYKDGAFTFTADALAAAADGKTTFAVVSDDNGVTRTYNISVTVWKNIISDPTELQAFAADLNQATTEASALKGWYKLDADIDMTEIDFVFGDLYGNPEKPEEGGNRFFAGLFDGEGHSIKGMKTGNRGLFNMVQHGAVVKNVAIIDAYAYGYKADGVQAEKNVSHGSNILAQKFYGTLENVYVSGSVGTGRWSYSGVVSQMRAQSVKDCLFDIELRAEATAANDSALGIWVTAENDADRIKAAEDIVLIYTGAEGKQMQWLGDATITISTYADNAECYAGIDISKFDSAYWKKEADGIYFGDEKVVNMAQEA